MSTEQMSKGPDKRLDSSWKRFGYAAAILVLIGIGLFVLSWAVVSERREDVSFPEPVTRVEIVIDNGEIAIVNDPAPAVRVVRKDSFVLRKPDVKQEIQDGALVVRQKCSGLRLGKCESKYVLTVPSDTPLTLLTSNGKLFSESLRNPAEVRVKNGSIEFDQTFATLNLTVDNGSIKASDVRSLKVSATANNGNLGVDFTAAPASVELRSTNGDVRAAVPLDESYRVNASTGNGRTVIDVPVDESSNRVITARSENGNVTVQKNEKTQ